MPLWLMWRVNSWVFPAGIKIVLADLHETSHDSVAEEKFVASGGKSWNDSVVRAFSSLQGIWMVLIEDETRSSVLECETATFRNS